MYQSRYDTDELYHHGTKGMKWGQRLYQTKSGSLTPLGRIRYGTDKTFRTKVKRQDALKKAREAKQKAKIEAEKRAKDVAEGKISARKMTNEELVSRVQRVEMEKRYNDAVLATHTGKRIASKLLNEALVPGVVEAGKHLTANVLKKYGSDVLGLNAKEEKSAHEKLKEKWEASKWEKEILSNKKQTKRMQKEAEEEEAAEEQNNKKQQESGKKTKNSGSDKTEKPDNSKAEIVDGIVEGVGTSKSKIKSDIDNGDDWVKKNINSWNVESHTPSVRESGEDYVNRLWSNEEEYLGRLRLQ